MRCELGQSVTLPSATATDETDGDISKDIVVKVFLGEQEKFSGKGNVTNTFTPDSVGSYVARYQVVNSKEVASDVKEINITVEQAQPQPEPKSPVITVDTDEQSFSEEENVILRSAKGDDGYGADISENIEVEVFDSTETVVFNGKGNVENNVGMLTPGTYTVRYSLSNEEGKTDSKEYLITVVAAPNVAPVLSAPEKDYVIFAGQSLAISSASAYDEEDGDLSDETLVRIERADGETVLEQRKATTFRHVFDEAGQYKVIYSVKDSKGALAEEKSFNVTVNATTDTMTIDGEVTEQQYNTFNDYVGGIGGQVTFRFYADDNGLYIGAIVKDTNLIASNDANLENRLNLMDGLEFSFNPFDARQADIKNTQCFRIRIGVDGSYKTYVPNNTDDKWKDGSMDLTGKFAVKTNGTVVYNKQTSMSEPNATDVDTGYSVELFLSWTDFGYTGRPNSEGVNYLKDYIRVNFGHRNVTNTEVRSDYRAPNAADAATASANNIFYNETNFNGRPLVAVQALHPDLYHFLRINDSNPKMLGINPSIASEEVVLDGYMEESFWKDAVTVPSKPTCNGGGHADKECYMIEEILDIQLAVRDPSRPDLAGTKNTAFVNTNDVPVTMLDAMGLSFDYEVPGMSLLDLMYGEVEPRQYMVCTTNGHFSDTRARTVYFGDYKYTYYTNDIDELYNLKEDPFEMTNLIFEKDKQGIINLMKNMLYNWQIEQRDNIPLINI
ncbi:MAG TPA: hypothetical protein IAD47_01915 [Candidatus Limihabitans stercoravium]|nr:hypothetical protein [Candidatus Limihabitans stercoravium]